MSFPILISHLKTTIRPNLSNLKLKFDEFFQYLEKNYFRVDSKFKPSIWSSFNSVNDSQDPENTSNSIESLNKRLGANCPNGKISFRKCCELLHSFKCDMLEDYEYLKLFAEKLPFWKLWLLFFTKSSVIAVSKY